MKKGQTASPQSYISLLIFMIGVLIIVYILMLPPGDRAELLDQNRTNADDGIKDDITVLMTREPGTLTNIAEDEVVNDLPAFNLFTRTDATIIEEYDSFYIMKSLFEEKTKEIAFQIDDSENTEDVVLSYTAPVNEGRLTIDLNGETIMSQELDTKSPSPLKLPADLLQDSNRLVFSTSGPGILFWEVNEFNIENLKITAEVTDVSGRENKQIVYITQQELDNLELFELSFAVDCKATAVAPIQIYLNKRQIYYSIPDCGSLVKVPAVSPQRLRVGENDLLFQTEKGNYQLYRIEANLELKEPVFPTYYFTLSKKEYNKVKKGDAYVNVTLLFSNDEDRKKGFLRVNGVRYDINTYDMGFNKKANEFIREGNNAVEIEPDTELDILELRVIFAE